MNKFKVPENVAISDSGFLFLPSSGETFTLNETGKDVFRLIQTGLTVDEIADRIILEYDVDKSGFQHDLHDFVQQLKSYSLINEL